MLKSKLLPLATIIFGLMPAGLNAASESEGETARWFTIEVIVFKTTDQQGYFAESWDKTVPLDSAKDRVDFLQPYEIQDPSDAGEAPLNSSSEAVRALSTNPRIGKDKDTSSIANQKANQGGLGDNNLQGVASDNALVQEIPFVKLNPELRQLTNEATSLSRHPEYQVIFHEAWRQPVLDASQAVKVRVAGGLDFSDRFDYDGVKKLILFAQDGQAINQDSDQILEEANGIYEASEQDNLALSFDEPSTLSNPIHGSSDDSIMNPDLMTTPEQPQLIPLPWVPELDGEIQIYLSRYLHIRTNLFLRRPDKEAVDVIDPDMLSQDAFQNLQIGAPNLFEEIPASIIAADNKTTSLSLDESLPQIADKPFSLKPESATRDNLLVNKKPQFSWEINDNFLETESEKMYIEKLFNYPLKQSRRVKSGELHYFDHPLMGILILITPYELEKDLKQTDGILPPSF